MILCVFESEIQPVQCVQHLHILLKELRIDHTLDNVMRHNILELHDQLVHHLFRKHRKVLYNDRVLRENRILTTLLRDGFSQRIIHCSQNSCASFLASVSCNLFVQNENYETANAHELLVRVVIAVIELIDDDFYSCFNLLPERLFISA